MRNKQGKMAPLVSILIVFAILAMGVIAYSVFQQTEVASPESPAAIKELTDCSVAPSLSFSVVNALAKGTQVTTHETTRLNGALQVPGVTPTSFQYGDSVVILYNATDYLDVIGSPHSMTCGTNTLNQEIYATDDPTLRIFNTDGNRIANNVLDTCVTNTGVNQSSSASSISMKIEIQSAPLQSSGDLVMVVEVDNSTEVAYSGITLSGTGVSDGDILSTYALNSTASVVRAFNLPASVNGVLNTYYLNLAPKSGESIGPADSAGTEVYVTLYSKQAFYDTDGTFKVGIENADGDTKYEDTSRFGFCVVGS